MAGVDMMQREEVERFTQLDYHPSQGNGGYMEPDTDGDWVRYSDYRALLDRAERAEAERAAAVAEGKRQVIAAIQAVIAGMRADHSPGLAFGALNRAVGFLDEMLCATSIRDRAKEDGK